MLDYYFAVCRSRLGCHLVPIYYGHSKVMRTASRPVSVKLFSKELRKCLFLLRMVLQGHPYWPVGVSAPQVGLNYRVIAFKDQSIANNPMRIIANPVFRPTSQAIRTGKEGCLSSLPNTTSIEVERWREIELEGFDCLKKRRFTGKFADLTAAVIQHEIDHLDAVPWPPLIGMVADSG